MDKRIKFLLIFLVLFLTNVLDVYRVSLSEAYVPKYYSETTIHDSWFVGSLLHSRYYGVYDEGPFSHRFMHGDCVSNDLRTCFEYQNCQFEYGKMLLDLGEWEMYKSSLRFPMSIYIILDRAIFLVTGSNVTSLKFYELIETFLRSLMLSLFIYWVFQRFGAIPVIGCVIFIIFNKSMNDVNVVGSVWIRYLCLSIVPIGDYVLNLKKPYRLYLFGSIVFVITCLNQSIQYESTFIVIGMLMSAVLLLWNSRDSLKKLFGITFLSSIIGVVFVLVIHFILLSIELQSVDEAIDWFGGKFIQRTRPAMFAEMSNAKSIDTQFEYNISFFKLLLYDIWYSEMFYKFKMIHFLVPYFIAILIFGKLRYAWLKKGLVQNERTLRMLLFPFPMILGYIGYYFVFTSHAAAHPALLHAYVNFGLTTALVLSTIVILQYSVKSTFSKP